MRATQPQRQRGAGLPSMPAAPAARLAGCAPACSSCRTAPAGRRRWSRARAPAPRAAPRRPQARRRGRRRRRRPRRRRPPAAPAPACAGASCMRSAARSWRARSRFCCTPARAGPGSACMPPAQPARLRRRLAVRGCSEHSRRAGGGGAPCPFERARAAACTSPPSALPLLQVHDQHTRGQCACWATGTGDGHHARQLRSMYGWPAGGCHTHRTRLGNCCDTQGQRASDRASVP